MHLFIIDLFISLDTVAPLIDGLNKNEQKTKICFVNPLQDFSNHKLIHYLNKSKFNNNHGTLCFGIHNKFFFLILKIIMSLPLNILKRLNRVWKNIYSNKILFNEKQLLNFFNKNQITSVTLENSLPSKKKNIIINACNKVGIPIICIASGLFTQKKDELIGIDFFENINFFLTPNLFAPYNKNILNSKKFILCGSPRYDYQWIKKLEEIYDYKYDLKNKKLKIAYFTRTTSYNYNQHLELIKKLKQIKNVEVKLGNKPREIVPLKVSLFGTDDLNTSELILWSDIVVSSATSVLVESVQRDKLTVCLEYLTPEKDNYASHFSNHDRVVSIANSSEEVIEIINNFNFNGKSKVIDKNDISLFLDSFIHMKNEGYNIIENIIKYYLNIKTLYKHK